MNTLLLLSMLSAPFCSNDTIVNATRPDSVVVCSDNGQTSVQIYGREDDHDYRFTYTMADNLAAVASVNEHSSSWDFNLPFSKPSKNQNNSAFKPSSVDLNLIDFIHVGAAVPVNAKGNVPVNAGWNLGADLLNIQYCLPSGNDALYIGLGIDWIFSVPPTIHVGSRPRMV